MWSFSLLFVILYSILNNSSCTSTSTSTSMSEEVVFMYVPSEDVTLMLEVPTMLREDAQQYVQKQYGIQYNDQIIFTKYLQLNQFNRKLMEALDCIPTGQPSNQPSEQPTTQPTTQPTSQPSMQPSDQPSRQPSDQPSDQPTSQPTNQPSTQPSKQPSRQPSTQPTNQPTVQPSAQPSDQPTDQPTSQPSTQPSDQPTGEPSGQPSGQPSSQPSDQPSRQPSGQPSAQPTDQPSRQPSGQPSAQPTDQPSSQPSGQPSAQPTDQPSRQPSGQPTSQPTDQPSSQPSGQPSAQPTDQPSRQPTDQPSRQPTDQPSNQPTDQPSSQPSGQPSAQPTDQPSRQPTDQPSNQPTDQPSNQPTSQPSIQPSKQPSRQPSTQPTNQPTVQPSAQPSDQPTDQPSSQPSTQPSDQPTGEPSGQPSDQPSNQPSDQPSRQPSGQPSAQPTDQPSRQPTDQPSGQPSGQPSEQPSGQPSRQPSRQPTGQPSSQPSGQPSDQPSAQPSFQPSGQPTTQPSDQPTCQPSKQPSDQPTKQPSGQPSGQPSTQPSGQPTRQPSGQPSDTPSSQPSDQPTNRPSDQPTSRPSDQPSDQPSGQPSAQPSQQPSDQPSCQPSNQPSDQPSSHPTSHPSGQPSSQPTDQPTGEPTDQPSDQPTDQPSSQPSEQPSDQPSGRPSGQPTSQPSHQPSADPSGQPTGNPSGEPSGQPSDQPSVQPSDQPSCQPTVKPSGNPSSQPSVQPSCRPTDQPSCQPSGQPSSRPTGMPSRIPSRLPTCVPSSEPTGKPTGVPSASPSSQPSGQPTNHPSGIPTSSPSGRPSSLPSGLPTQGPTGQPSGTPINSRRLAFNMNMNNRNESKAESSPSSYIEPSHFPSSMQLIPIHESLVQGVTYQRRVTNPPIVVQMISNFFPSNSLQNDFETVVMIVIRQHVLYFSIELDKNNSLEIIQQHLSSAFDLPLEEQNVYINERSNRKLLEALPCIPTGQPSNQPSSQPSGQPSDQPTAVPSAPTGEPSAQPSGEPTYVPTKRRSCPLVTAFVPQVSSIVYPIIAITSIYAESRLVNISFALSTKGTLICSLYRSTAASPDLTNDIVSQSHQVAYAFSENDVISVTYVNVEPETAYDLYCVARSPNSFLWTGRTDMLVQARSVLSAGSREAVVTVADPTAIESVSPSVMVRVHLTSQPKEYLKVNVLLLADASNSESENITLQSVDGNLFDRSWWMKDIYFLTAPELVGSYRVMVMLSGLNADDYGHSFPNGDIISIFPTQNKQPPSILSVQYSTNGLEIYVQFSRNVHVLDETFSCILVFSFVGVDRSRCSWIDSTLAAIYLTVSDNSPRIGDNFTVLGGTIRSQCYDEEVSKCETWMAMNQSSYHIQPPVVRRIPTVVIVAPKMIGRCTNLSLDLSVSSGGLGRRWASVRIKVSSENEASAELVNKYLDQLSFDLTKPVIILEGFLGQNISYDIYVELCNVFGDCGKGVHSLYVTYDTIPVLSLRGGNSIIVKASSHIDIFADAYVTQCNGNVPAAVSKDDIDYSWCLNENGTQAAAYLAVSDFNPAHAYILPFSLMKNSIYEVIVTANYLDKTSYSTVLIKVEESTIIAVIAGPSSVTLSLGKSYVLNATGSYDDGFPLGKAHSDDNLWNFTWGCYVTAPSFSQHCDEFNVMSLSSRDDAISVSMSSGRTSMVGHVLNVYVTVYDPVRHIHDKASVLITLTTSDAPLVTLSSRHALTNNIINAEDKLQLLAKITRTSDSITPISMEWTVNDKSIDLKRIALSSVANTIKAASFTMNLVIKSNSLSYTSKPLIFRISSTDNSAGASIAIRVNRAPEFGEFSVSPQTGLAFSTTFAFSSLYWEDDELPLTHSFGYKSKSALPRVLKKGVGFLNSMLPRGQKRNDGVGDSLSCINIVRDSMGASATSIFNVAVNENVDSIKVVQQLDYLNNLKTDTSLARDETKTIIFFASEAINYVECSEAPNCTLLSRHECSSKVNTCGSCYSSFVGENGNSNTPCISTGEIGEPLQAGRSGTCVEDADCNHMWYSCVQTSIASKSCVKQDKQCSSDCSVHGKCVFVNRNTGDEVPICKLGDAMCAAECVCHSGYTGSSCSMTREQIQIKSNITHVLLQSFRSLFNSIGQDEVSLIDSISVFDSIIQDEFSISTVSLELSMGFFSDILTAVEETSNLSLEEIEPLMNILDILTKSILWGIDEKIILCPDKDTPLFMDTFIRLNAQFATRMVPNQYATETLADMFRVTTVPHMLFSMGDESIATPQTTLEVNNKITPTSVESQNIFPVTSFTMVARLFHSSCGGEYVSNPTAVLVDTSEFAVKPALSDSTFSAKLTMPNVRTVKYPNVFRENSWSTICVTGDRTEYNYTCLVTLPSLKGGDEKSNYTISHQCKGHAESMRTFCPTVSVTPQCNILNGTKLGVTCHVESFVYDSTVCVCQKTNANNGSDLNAEATYEDRDLLFVVTTSSVTVDDTSVTSVASMIYRPPELETSFMSFSLVVCLTVLAVVCVAMEMKSGKSSPSVQTMCEKIKLVMAMKDEHLQEEAETLGEYLSRKPRTLACSALKQHVQSVLPRVYQSSVSILDRAWLEICHHHRYISVLLSPKPEDDDELVDSMSRQLSPRLLRIIHIATVQSVGLLVLVVLFVLQYPDDDGSCANHILESTCTSRLTILDPHRTVCNWRMDIADDNNYYSCRYTNPGFSFDIVLRCCSIAALCEGISSLFVTIICHKLLAPNTYDESTKNFKSLHKVIPSPSLQSGVHIEMDQRDMDSYEKRFDSSMHQSPLTSVPATKSQNFTFHIRESAALSSQVASNAVTKAWSDGPNLLENGFCDQIFIPELLILHKGMINFSMSDLGIDVKLLPNRSETERFRFGEFMYCLKKQRRQLHCNPRRQLFFDRDWQLSSDGKMLENSGSSSICGMFQWPPLCYRHDILLERECHFVLADSEKESAMLLSFESSSLPIITGKVIGTRILQLFLVDLLRGQSSAAAKEFKMKLNDKLFVDENISASKKTAGYVMIASVISLCVGGTLYICSLKSFDWQLQLVIAYLFSIILEVICIESFSCIFHHCIIPIYFADKVEATIATVNELITYMCTTSRNVRETRVLDTTRYLFVSNSIAKKFPNLVESALVLSYHTYSPGPLRGGLLKSMDIPAECCLEHVIKLFRLVTFFITRVGAFLVKIPHSIRFVILHCLLPLSFLMVVYKCSKQTANKFVGVVFGVSIAYLSVLYVCYYHKESLHKVRIFCAEKRSPKVLPENNDCVRNSTVINRILPDDDVEHCNTDIPLHIDNEDVNDTEMNRNSLFPPPTVIPYGTTNLKSLTPRVNDNLECSKIAIKYERGIQLPPKNVNILPVQIRGSSTMSAEIPSRIVDSTTTQSMFDPCSRRRQVSDVTEIMLDDEQHIQHSDDCGDNCNETLLSETLRKLQENALLSLLHEDELRQGINDEADAKDFFATVKASNDDIIELMMQDGNEKFTVTSRQRKIYEKNLSLRTHSADDNNSSDKMEGVLALPSEDEIMKMIVSE